MKVRIYKNENDIILKFNRNLYFQNSLIYYKSIQPKLQSDLKMKTPKTNKLLFLSPTVQAGWENQSYRTDFQNIKTLGKGSFGLVWQGRHKKTGKMYAIKQIKKKAINSPKLLQHVKTQVRIMYLLNHPNIIKLYNHFEDDFSIYFVLQFAQKGQLYRYMMNESHQRRLPQQEASKYVKQVVEALLYIHKQNIIHRDIKPENILIDKEGNVKLADFGWSNFVEQLHSKRQTYCGTLDYLAPEMIEKSHKHDYRVDIWSVGVLIYELVNGFSPFSYELIKTNEVSEIKVKENISKLNYKFTHLMSDESKDLVAKILLKEPEKRSSLNQILNHPWIKKYQVKKQIHQEEFQKKWYEKVKDQFQQITNSQTKLIEAFTEEQIYNCTRIQGILNKKINQYMEKQTQNAKQLDQLQLKVKQLQLKHMIKDQQLRQLKLSNQNLLKNLTKDSHDDCRQRAERLMQTIRQQSQQIKNMHIKILENQRKLRQYAQK